MTGTVVARAPTPVSALGASDDVPFAEIFPILLYVLLLMATTAAQGLYQGLERPQPAALSILQPLATWSTVWAWFYGYARRHRIALIMDFGWLFAAVWPVVVFYYLFKRQRWRALFPAAAYGVLMGAAILLGLFVRLAVSPR
jgi:hypothetical protein